MPTGYTNLIEKGEVKTPKEFLQVCLRAFGVMIDYRDEPLSVSLPETLIHNTYYEDKYKEMLERLNEYKAKEDSLWQKELDGELWYTKQKYAEEIEKETKLIKLYQSFEEAIGKWDCDEQFKDIKSFALNQIRISMPKISENSYYEEKIERLESTTAEKYKEERIKSVEKDLLYYEEEMKRHEEAFQKKQEFLDDFKKELEKLE